MALMFNAEKLLGQIAGELIGGATKKKGNNSLLSSLSSGGGLMTLIGLGVGAYEIFQSQQQAKAGQASAAPPPPPPGTGPATPPPFPSGNQTGPAAPMPPPVSSPAVPQPVQAANVDTQDLALRIIRVMIAAAHADGNLDQDEEARILGQAENSGLSREERLFLLDELHHPKSIAELTAGIVDPTVTRALYLAAVSGIEVDTDEERSFLDELAAHLGISKTLQDFIENQQ